MESKWTDRTALLLGGDKMQRLAAAHILVVGVGGVGAYAAEMLCRAGVGEMTIIDADTINVTNINRQLPATHSTIGLSKVEVLILILKFAFIVYQYIWRMMKWVTCWVMTTFVSLSIHSSSMPSTQLLLNVP